MAFGLGGNRRGLAHGSRCAKTPPRRTHGRRQSTAPNAPLRAQGVPRLPHRTADAQSKQNHRLKASIMKESETS